MIVNEECKQANTGDTVEAVSFDENAESTSSHGSSERLKAKGDADDLGSEHEEKRESDGAQSEDFSDVRTPVPASAFSRKRLTI